MILNSFHAPSRPSLMRDRNSIMGWIWKDMKFNCPVRPHTCSADANSPGMSTGWPVRLITSFCWHQIEILRFSIWSLQSGAAHHSLGFVDENLGGSPGWWAATVATYCPSRPEELPTFLSSKPCEWRDAQQCMWLWTTSNETQTLKQLAMLTPWS